MPSVKGPLTYKNMTLQLKEEKVLCQILELYHCGKSGHPVEVMVKLLNHDPKLLAKWVALEVSA